MWDKMVDGKERDKEMVCFSLKYRYLECFIQYNMKIYDIVMQSSINAQEVK